MTHFTFVGDPHGQANNILADIQGYPAAMTVLLGDMCFDQPIDQVFDGVKHLTALHWIHGNHDTDRETWFHNLFESPWASRSLSPSDLHTAKSVESCSRRGT